MSAAQDDLLKDSITICCIRGLQGNVLFGSAIRKVTSVKVPMRSPLGESTNEMIMVEGPSHDIRLICGDQVLSQPFIFCLGLLASCDASPLLLVQLVQNENKEECSARGFILDQEAILPDRTMPFSGASYVAGSMGFNCTLRSLLTPFERQALSGFGCPVKQICRKLLWLRTLIRRLFPALAWVGADSCDLVGVLLLLELASAGCGRLQSTPALRLMQWELAECISLQRVKIERTKKTRSQELALTHVRVGKRRQMRVLSQRSFLQICLIGQPKPVSACRSKGVRRLRRVQLKPIEPATYEAPEKGMVWSGKMAP